MLKVCEGLFGPGQTADLTFQVGRDDLTFINSDNKPVAEPGDFDVLVGGLKDRFILK